MTKRRHTNVKDLDEFNSSRIEWRSPLERIAVHERTINYLTKMLPIIQEYEAEISALEEYKTLIIKMSQGITDLRLISKYVLERELSDNARDRIPKQRRYSVPRSNKRGADGKFISENGA